MGLRHLTGVCRVLSADAGHQPSLLPHPFAPLLDSQYFPMMIFLHHQMAFDAFA